MQNLTSKLIFRTLLLVALALGLAACGGGDTGSTGNPPQVASTSVSSVVFGGSVGDGPVTGASINVISITGQSLGKIFSDDRARYQASISPALSDYPLRLQVNGGIDLVTGKQPDFTMESVMISPSETVVNINPFSTLITQIARQLPGGLTQNNISTAKTQVLDRMSFGLDRSVMPDPISTPISNSNVAQLVKASEALGEVVRRTRYLINATGSGISGNTIMAALAADMTDGYPDGLGNPGTDATVTAVFNVVTGQVLVEALSNKLRVGGIIATSVIDQSIISTHPGVSSGQLTGSVRTTNDVLVQARVALAAAQVLDGSSAVANIAAALNGLSANTTAGSVESILPSNSGNTLNTAVNIIPNASAAQVNAVNQTVFAMGDTGSGSSGSGSSGTGGSGGGSPTTGSFSLAWTAPTLRTDGSPLSLADIAGYRIYYGSSKGNYSNQANVTNGSLTSKTVNNLAIGTYYLVMTTYDNAGLESNRSPEVTKSVP